MLSTIFSVVIVITVLSLLVFYMAMKAETYMRYTGIRNVTAEKIAKTVWGMEMNAKSVFDEVGKHMDSPDDVIAALESKANLNPDVNGYFAAFEPNYFPQAGMWFEPYVHQADSSGQFQVRLVGSARHDYTKSDWYVHAKRTHASFWSDPYYYYDGTSISGHYCTFVKPICNEQQQLICVCGADMTLEWLTKDLERIDKLAWENEELNRYRMRRDLDFFTVVLNHDGSCIAHPEGKKLTISDDKIIADLTQQKSGTADINFKGVPSTVFYGPIDHVSWSVAVIVPKNDIWQALALGGGVLLAVAVIGLIVIWVVIKRTRYEKAD